MLPATVHVACWEGNNQPWGHKRQLAREALGLSEEWVALGCRGEGLRPGIEEGVPSGTQHMSGPVWTSLMLGVEVRSEL